MEMGEKGNVCVTGAGGFVASWLVKLLLSKGYKVHGTVRDPVDENNTHLKKLENASSNLQLFKADLLDYDDLSAAIAGCDGVFHVASPLPPGKVTNPEIELIAPAVTGTQHVLRACLEARVKRIVVVSSIAAVSLNPNWPKDKVKDEDCWSDKEYCKTTENWYCLSKTTAEGVALEYAEENGLDVVTVLPSFILGPQLQPTVNASSLFLIKHLTGVFDSTENHARIFVDVRDVAEALLLVYEKPEASGRYICAPHSTWARDFFAKVKSMYPGYSYPNNFIEVDGGSSLCSGKLERLGWKYRSLEESIVDSVESYKEAGLLNKQ